MPLFELFMLFNDQVNDCYQNARDSVMELSEYRRSEALILTLSFAQHDFQNADVLQLVFCQIYKAMMLCRYLAENTKYELLVEEFLRQLNCRDLKDFLIRFGGIVLNALKSNKSGFTTIVIPTGENYEADCDFFEKFCVNDFDEYRNEQNDYLILRNNPLYKVERGRYRVIFDLFLIKKTYNGMIFKLSALDRENKRINKSNNQKFLFSENFLGTIRNEFSEANLTYTCFEQLYNNPGVVKINGNQFKETGLDREADYYLRVFDNILLVESKDFYIPGDAKLSYDFRIIESTLKENKLGVPDRLGKAVVQLERNIRRVLDRKMILDTDYDPLSVNIYPVILVHDSLYSAPGLNHWVHFWLYDFLRDLKANENYKEFDFNRIRNVTIVEIDSLILYINYFKNGLVDLFSLLSDFHDYVEFGKTNFSKPIDSYNHFIKAPLSFSEFMRNTIESKPKDMELLSHIKDLFNHFDTG